MERQAGLNTQGADRGRRKAVRVEAKGWRAILKIDKAIWVFLVFGNDMPNDYFNRLGHFTSYFLRIN